MAKIKEARHVTLSNLTGDRIKLILAVTRDEYRERLHALPDEELTRDSSSIADFKCRANRGEYILTQEDYDEVVFRAAMVTEEKNRRNPKKVGHRTRLVEDVLVMNNLKDVYDGKNSLASLNNIDFGKLTAAEADYNADPTPANKAKYEAAKAKYAETEKLYAAYRTRYAQLNSKGAKYNDIMSLYTQLTEAKPRHKKEMQELIEAAVGGLQELMDNFVPPRNN